MPYWLNTSVIIPELSKYGEVSSHEFENIFSEEADGSHIRSSVRKVHMTVSYDNFDKIPYILKVNDMEILLTIRGRPPLCLKCRHRGHIRSTCNTPYCRRCQVFGHITEDCLIHPDPPKHTSDTSNTSKSPIHVDHDESDIDSYEDLPDGESSSPTAYPEADKDVDFGSQIHGITSLSSTPSRSTLPPSTPSVKASLSKTAPHSEKMETSRHSVNEEDSGSQIHGITSPPNPSSRSTKRPTLPSDKPSLPESDPHPKSNASSWQTSSKKRKPSPSVTTEESTLDFEDENPFRPLVMDIDTVDSIIVSSEIDDKT